MHTIALQRSRYSAKETDPCVLVISNTSRALPLYGDAHSDRQSGEPEQHAARLAASVQQFGGKLPVNDIEVACRNFQAASIVHCVVFAVLFNHSVVLQTVCRSRDAHQSHSDHVAEKLIGHPEAVAVNLTLARSSPTRIQRILRKRRRRNVRSNNDLALLPRWKFYR